MDFLKKKKSKKVVSGCLRYEQEHCTNNKSRLQIARLSVFNLRCIWFIDDKLRFSSMRNQLFSLMLKSWFEIKIYVKI